jgi:hypothetical protein
MLVDRARKLLTVATDGAAPDIVRRAAQDFIDASRKADASELHTALEILSGAYSLPPTGHLPMALTTAGALVERGANPTPLVAPVVEFLKRVTPPAADFHDACIAQIPPDADEEDEDETFRQIAVRLRSEMPEAAAAWAALETLYAPVIAVLAASPTARTQSRSIAPKMDQLREHNDGASWMAPMLMVLDREPILAIEPDTGLGLVGRMSGISSSFQLHVLLMDIFPQSDVRSDRRISQKAGDIVRGRVKDQQDDAPLVGRWNMHAWTALRGAGELPHDHDESSIRSWIWNEGVPADIPVFDGYRVVVLGPASYARSFFAQREFLGLRADIEVERLLSADEVNAWVKRFSQGG